MTPEEKRARWFIQRVKQTPTQKAARADVMKRWREANREQILAYRREYYRKNAKHIYRIRKPRLKAHSAERKAADRAYQREWMKKWRKANPERTKEIKRRCVEKNRDKFLSRRRERLANDPAYRALQKKRFQAWAKSPKGKASDANRHHLRRARKNAVISVSCRARITELRKSKTCHWCDRELTPETVTVDHVTPLVRGGSHTPDNLVAACKRCNYSKGSKLPEEWAQGLAA